jgi:3-deoxy-D-manno-octulosonic-acid transferase
MCFILAPHEISEAHLRHLEAQMARRGLSSGRYSSAEPDRRRRVLLIDQVGVLAELYTWGQVAFVGGSFRRQVHSVMEPLAAGLPVVVGPFHHNNREALAYQKKNINTLPLVFSADSAEEIVGFLEQVQKWPAQDLRHQVRAEVLKNQGSTTLLLGEIKGALYKPLDSQD